MYPNSGRGASPSRWSSLPAHSVHTAWRTNGAANSTAVYGRAKNAIPTQIPAMAAQIRGESPTLIRGESPTLIRGESPTLIRGELSVLFGTVSAARLART
jgi:hypothetical protein